MRITFILPNVGLSGGIRVVGIYAKALVEKGHEIVLISPPPPVIPARQKIKSLITGRGWPGRSQSNSHLDGLDLDHRVLDRCRPVTDRDVPDADIVIATWWETAEWVNALSNSKGAKMYFVQGHEVHDHLPLERCRATYSLPLHKIVVAKWLKNVMRDEYGDTDVDLVPNSVDHHQFFSGVRGKQSVPTVGFLFSYAKLKGVDVTLQAIHKLRIIFSDLRVISFGSSKPNGSGEFDSRIEFYFSPEQGEIRNLYAQCDVWLTASRTEGFNLPAMEAMACRTPVVSTRTGWPEEAIVSGKNGILVDVDDVDAFTQGAASILSLSDAGWREMSRNAYDTVSASTWEESAQKFENVLERVRRQSQTLP